MELYKKFKKGTNTVLVGDNYDSDSPREWSNLGIIECERHRNWRLPNEGDQMDSDLITKYAVQQVLDNPDLVGAIPIYLHSHSNTHMALHTYGSDGQLQGVMYTYSSRFEELYGEKFENTPEQLEKISKSFEIELEYFNAYAAGEVYQFVVQDENGETIDSCGGFYIFDEDGRDNDIEDINSYLDEGLKISQEEWKNSEWLTPKCVRVY